jgi:Domain of unknown function (DUF5122) beta-propeller
MIHLGARVRALAIDRGGKILVAGSIKRQFGLILLNPDGTLHRRFGKRGWVRSEVATSSEIVDLHLEPGGRIVVAGWSSPCEEPDVFCPARQAAVARYRASGTLDRGFGRGGVWRKEVGASSELEAISLGKNTITVAGWTETGHDRDYLIARLER